MVWKNGKSAFPQLGDLRKWQALGESGFQGTRVVYLDPFFGGDDQLLLWGPDSPIDFGAFQKRRAPGQLAFHWVQIPSVKYDFLLEIIHMPKQQVRTWTV